MEYIEWGCEISVYRNDFMLQYTTLVCWCYKTAIWRSSNATVCKTVMGGCNARCGLNKTRMVNSLVARDGLPCKQRALWAGATPAVASKERDAFARPKLPNGSLASDPTWDGVR